MLYYFKKSLTDKVIYAEMSLTLGNINLLKLLLCSVLTTKIMLCARMCTFKSSFSILLSRGFISKSFSIISWRKKHFSPSKTIIDKESQFYFVQRIHIICCRKSLLRAISKTKKYVHHRCIRLAFPISINTTENLTKNVHIRINKI